MDSYVDFRSCVYVLSSCVHTLTKRSRDSSFNGRALVEKTRAIAEVIKNAKRIESKLHWAKYDEVLAQYTDAQKLVRLHSYVITGQTRVFFAMDLLINDIYLDLFVFL